METRRRRGMKTEPLETGTEEDSAEAVEDIAHHEQAVEEVPQPPKKSKTKHKRKLVSPTGVMVLAKLKERQKLDQQKIAYLENHIKHLEEANRELRNDKDFLVAQLKGPPKTSPSPSTSGSGKTPLVVTSSSTSSSPSLTQSSSSSSSEEEEKKKKKKKAKKSRKHILTSRSRMTTIEGVILRYKTALKKFHSYGSMKKAFSKINVDRNTIARTAVIAELAIIFPDTFKDLLSQHEENETISQFAEKCTKAITKDMADTMTQEKKEENSFQ